MLIKAVLFLGAAKKVKKPLKNYDLDPEQPLRRSNEANTMPHADVNVSAFTSAWGIVYQKEKYLQLHLRHIRMSVFSVSNPLTSHFRVLQ